MNIKVEKTVVESHELNVGDVVKFSGDISRGEWEDRCEIVVYITPKGDYFVYLSSGYPRVESVDKIFSINGSRIR